VKNAGQKLFPEIKLKPQRKVAVKILPRTGQEWLSFLALPFKLFVLAYGLIYPAWLHSMPGRPGTIGGPDYSVIDELAIGYFFTFLTLLVIAIIQAFTKNRRSAFWSGVFAILALCLAIAGAFHPYYK
jgi:hypothetical protein